MWEQAVEELLALEKGISAKLTEIAGLSKELAEAVDRGDQTSVQMVLASRQTPVLELREMFSTVDLKRCDLSGKDVERFDSLMKNGGGPSTAEEKLLVDRVMLNQRLLEQIVELDKKVNEKLCRGNSMYKRENA